MSDSEYELEPDEPPKPKPPGPPGGYLPRLTYKPPEPDPEDEEGEDEAEAESGQTPRKKKKKAKPQADAPSSPSRQSRAPGASTSGRRSREPAAPAPLRRSRSQPASDNPDRVLKEDTPEFDTYEARRRTRLIVGIVAGSVLLFSSVTVIRALMPASESFDDVPTSNEPTFINQGSAPAPASPARKTNLRETQANALLTEARQYARKGRIELAKTRLDVLQKTFEKTPAAREAAAALAREADGFPLFPDAPIVQADASDTSAETVEAEEARPEGPSGPAEAQVQPPPAEIVAAAPDAAAPAIARKFLPEGYQARPGAGLHHESGWPREIVCDRDHASLVLVPGGSYRLGNDRGALAERPEHTVVLSTFYIDRHEVTNRQMEAFRDASGGSTPEGSEPATPDRPAVNVSLADARAYAEWAGRSLPSEAQWEAAARSFDARLYPGGSKKPEWETPREPRQIDPAMSFPSDVCPSGAFDLAGNAWEWTNDIFSASYYETLKPEPAVDPTGPARSHSRIIEFTVKGGSPDWDLAWRSGMRPEAKLPYLGFRCVLKVEDAPPPSAVPQPNPAAPNAPPSAAPAQGGGGAVPF